MTSASLKWITPDKRFRHKLRRSLCITLWITILPLTCWGFSNRLRVQERVLASVCFLFVQCNGAKLWKYFWGSLKSTFYGLDQSRPTVLQASFILNHLWLFNPSSTSTYNRFVELMVGTLKENKTRRTVLQASFILSHLWLFNPSSTSA